MITSSYRGYSAISSASSAALQIQRARGPHLNASWDDLVNCSPSVSSRLLTSLIMSLSLRVLSILLVVAMTADAFANNKPIAGPPQKPYQLFPISSSPSDPLPARVINFLFVNPTKLIINTVGDLLRISGDTVYMPSLSTLAIQRLVEELATVQPNGLRATPSQRQTIDVLARQCEALNPTPTPAASMKMFGRWRLLYTDLQPAAPSGGQLGPFVGEVYQTLSPSSVTNSLSVKFPPLTADLTASAVVLDGKTWEISFRGLAVSLGGLPVWSKSFVQPDGSTQVREWVITHLSDELRILRARNPSKESGEGFLFVLRREGGSA